MKTSARNTIVTNCWTTVVRLSRFGAAVAAFSLALLQSEQIARGAIYTLQISSTVPWTDTGIDISAGSQLNITATGIVNYGGHTGDANGGNWDGTQYFPDAVYPNTIVVSLIGKIGGTIDVGTGTPVPEGTAGKGLGFVGTSYNKTILADGRLFLGFNDLVPSFGDNSGSFSVTAVVTPVPEPSALAFVGAGVLALIARRNRRQRASKV